MCEFQRIKRAYISFLSDNVAKKSVAQAAKTFRSFRHLPIPPRSSIASVAVLFLFGCSTVDGNRSTFLQQVSMVSDHDVISSPPSVQRILQTKLHRYPSALYPLAQSCDSGSLWEVEDSGEYKTDPLPKQDNSNYPAKGGADNIKLSFSVDYINATLRRCPKSGDRVVHVVSLLNVDMVSPECLSHQFLQGHMGKVLKEESIPPSNSFLLNKPTVADQKLDIRFQFDASNCLKSIFVSDRLSNSFRNEAHKWPAL